MKNKKVISNIIIAIVVVLYCVVMAFVIRNVRKDIAKVANQNVQNTIQEESVNNVENQNTVSNNETIQVSSQDIQNNRITASNTNSISSRSEVDRTTVNNNQTQSNLQTESTVKIEDVKISFNMDVSKTTGLSQQDFVTLIQNLKSDKTGILAENAAWIWECCQKYNVNEIFVIGVCGIESGWCSAPQHQNAHNYASLMKNGKLIKYSSDKEGFEAMIKLLGEKYLNSNGRYYHGATITGVGTCYCNTTTWPGKVFKCMQQVIK